MAFMLAAFNWTRFQSNLQPAFPTLRDEQCTDYDVIACIAGRGFKVWRDDMR